jgi:hypothetical protein
MVARMQPAFFPSAKPSVHYPRAHTAAEYSNRTDDDRPGMTRDGAFLA